MKQVLEVVVPFAPREDATPDGSANYLRWRQYVTLIDLQRATAQKFGHRHTVVCDREIEGLDVMLVMLPAGLMEAIIAAQLHFLRRWDDQHPVVMLDADCLIARDLAGAFDGSFDIGVTNRINPSNQKQPINNGAMYFAAGSRRAALDIFEATLAHTVKLGAGWGDDQVALAKALSPVPNHYGVEVRRGARIAFLSMLSHNCAPSEEGRRHKKSPFIVHFKGDRKPWMQTYAERFVL